MAYCARFSLCFRDCVARGLMSFIEGSRYSAACSSQRRIPSRSPNHSESVSMMDVNGGIRGKILESLNLPVVLVILHMPPSCDSPAPRDERDVGMAGEMVDVSLLSTWSMHVSQLFCHGCRMYVGLKASLKYALAQNDTQTIPRKVFKACKSRPGGMQAPMASPKHVFVDESHAELELNDVLQGCPQSNIFV